MGGRRHIIHTEHDGKLKKKVPQFPTTLKNSFPSPSTHSTHHPNVDAICRSISFHQNNYCVRQDGRPEEEGCTQRSVHARVPHPSPVRVRVPAPAGVCLVDDPSLFARGTLLRFPQGVEKSDEAKTAAAAAKNTSFSSRRSHPGTHRTSWQHNTNTHTQMARETTEPRASFFFIGSIPLTPYHSLLLLFSPIPIGFIE